MLRVPVLSHAQGARPERAPGGDEERPARIDDGECSEDEQPYVNIQVEWRRGWRKKSHRRVEKNWDGEDQADPEPVAHVAHHRRQVLTPMPHFMRHLRRHSGLCDRRCVPLVAVGWGSGGGSDRSSYRYFGCRRCRRRARRCFNSGSGRRGHCRGRRRGNFRQCRYRRSRRRVRCCVAFVTGTR